MMFDGYPDIVSVEQLTRMLNIGKSSVYALLRNNYIRHVRVGKKYIIPKHSVIAFALGICYNERQIIGGGLQSVMEGEILK